MKNIFIVWILQDRDEKVKKIVAKMRQIEAEGDAAEGDDVDRPAATAGKARLRRDPTGRQRVFGSMTAPEKVDRPNLTRSCLPQVIRYFCTVFSTCAKNLNTHNITV